MANKFEGISINTSEKAVIIQKGRLGREEDHRADEAERQEGRLLRPGGAPSL